MFSDDYPSSAEECERLRKIVKEQRDAIDELTESLFTANARIFTLAKQLQEKDNVSSKFTGFLGC